MVVGRLYYALLLKGKFACKMKLCGEKPSQSQSHAILVIGLCDERKLRAESGIRINVFYTGFLDRKARI